MTRWVCPKNGQMVRNCPTCRRDHIHLREEWVPAKSKAKPNCHLHKIDLVPEEKA